MVKVGFGFLSRKKENQKRSVQTSQSTEEVREEGGITYEVPGPRGCENIAEDSGRRYRAQKTQMSPGYDPRAEATW